MAAALLTPATGYRDAAWAVRWPSLRDDQRETLRLVERNGLRLLKLINTLLDFSTILSAY